MISYSLVLALSLGAINAEEDLIEADPGGIEAANLDTCVLSPGGTGECPAIQTFTAKRARSFGQSPLRFLD